MMKKPPSIFLATIAAILLSFCEAFQPAPQGRIKGVETSETALRVSEQKPRWTDLPRERKSGPELSGFEIITGRVAMVGFCGLLAREVASGQSFGEQIVHAFSTETLANLPI